MKIRTVIKKLIEIEKELPKAEMFAYTDEEVGRISKIEIPKKFKNSPSTRDCIAPDPRKYKDGIVFFTCTEYWHSFDSYDDIDSKRGKAERNLRYKTR